MGGGLMRRGLIATVALLAWVAGSFVGSIAGPSAAHATGVAGIVIGKAHAGYTPDPSGRRTVTILAVGSDARPGQDPQRSRSDSIHLIFLHPRKQQAVIVGIPRDSWVSIPGLGTNKINAAMASGGPERLVQTVERTFGARIDYWALTSFWGITRMVNEIGGLDVRVTSRMHDSSSGSNFTPGLRHLNGGEVLAFARDRHSLQTGDFGRQLNGGRVFLAALAQFQKEYRRDPGRVVAWIGAGMRHMDTDLSVPQLLRLAFDVTGVRLRDVANVVLSGGGGSVGGRSVVFLSIGTARQIVADAEADGALRRR